MKKLNGALMMFFFTVTCYAITLPDGTNVAAKSIGTYESGVIKTVTFNIPVLINTKYGEFEFKKELSFYENGVIEDAYLNNTYIIPTKYGDLNFDGWIRFYDTGEMRLGLLKYEDQFINTKYGEILVSEHIKFYRNGNILECESFYLTTYIEANEADVWLLSFDQEENISQVRFQRGTIIDRNKDIYEPEEALLNSDGTIRFVNRMKPIVIQVNQKHYIDVKSIYYDKDFIAYLPVKSINIDNFIFGDKTFLVLDDSKIIIGSGIYDQENAVFIPKFF
ncbi:MAG TPA: hypothetical protein VJ861_03735 [Treponemataceae bacterium]|nr:hypothetical protein [Treponemataceae bacterium]